MDLGDDDARPRARNTMRIAVALRPDKPLGERTHAAGRGEFLFGTVQLWRTAVCGAREGRLDRCRYH